MKLAIATLLFGTATATSSIRAGSKVGQSLLSRARRLDGDNDISWAANYSLKFEKCATSTDYYGGYFGGNGENNNQQNDRQDWNGVYEQRLVHFKLCPTDTCGSGCSGGADYVIDMNEYVGAYLEYKEEAEQQECERVAENCYCENANDDEACEAQCYVDAGIYDQCVEQDNQNGNNGQQDEFELQEVVECAGLDVDEEAAQAYYYQNGGANNANAQYNNYNNGQQNGGQQQEEMEFFVGPYCSANGKSILLGVFMDEVCSYSAPDGIYEKFNYGKALPYSSTSIIKNDCISCMEVEEEDNNNNNNNNYNNNNQNQEEPKVIEVCERLYEQAGKCESNLGNIYGLYPNTMACDFIEGLNPWGKTRITAQFNEMKKNVTAPVLAGVFAATTVIFGAVAVYFHKKTRTASTVGLVHGEGNMA